MQYRLSTLLIIMALVGVYFGILNMPTFIAGFLFFAAVLVTPAYWVTGVIYARNERRAFFIGGIAGGAVPYVVLGIFAMVLTFDGPWRWGRNRYQFGETQMMNMMLSAFIFAPVVLAFLGGWIGERVYRRLQTAANDSIPVAPLQPAVKPHPLDRDVETVNK